MTFTFHQACTPVFLRGLHNLSALIDKAEASGVAEAEIMEARLAPDMHPFPRQVQIVSDTSKLAVARLAGVEAPPMADTETTFAELKARLAATVAFIEGVEAAKFEGAEDREVTLKFPNGEMRFTGADYLTSFATPNFYFHMTVAYALLRMKGVAVGKMDFLGAPPR